MTRQPTEAEVEAPMISETTLAEKFENWIAWFNSDHNGVAPTITPADLRAIFSELDAARARADELERERDKLIASVGEHVTVRGDYYARATLAESRLAELMEANKNLHRRAQAAESAALAKYEEERSEGKYVLGSASNYFQKILIAERDLAESNLAEAVKALEEIRDDQVCEYERLVRVAEAALASILGSEEKSIV